MTPSEAYRKYEFLDYLLSDREWLRGGQGGILFDLWQAVKIAANLPAFLTTLAPGELTTALATVLGIDRERLANMVMALQSLELMEDLESEEASAG